MDESAQFVALWEFGAPGHGKGVWDGVAAWMKRDVRQAIIDGCVLTSRKLILIPADVAEHLSARFSTYQFEIDHSQKVIKQVVVTFVDASLIIRPVIKHKFAQMAGMKKTFLFMAVRDSVVLEKRFSCWCHGCFNASLSNGGLVLERDRYICHDCVTSSTLSWKETSVPREDSPGIAHARAVTRNKARELRGQLARQLAHTSAPVWVGVQNRGEDSIDQYWVGRALRVSKVHAESGSVSSVTNRRERYDVGDIEFAVEWYERDISGGDERRILKREHTDREMESGNYTFNSSELRAINIEMTRVSGVGVALNVIQRQSTRGAAVHAQQRFRHILRPVTEVRAAPPDTLWEISPGSESLILQWCCP